MRNPDDDDDDNNKSDNDHHPPAPPRSVRPGADSPAPSPPATATSRSGVDALPVAPSMAPALARENLAPDLSASAVDRRTVALSAIAVALAVAASAAAVLLARLISLVTNLAFYGRFSAAPASPAQHHLGALVIAVPVLGGLIVGVMARFGSPAIRGHGIPEAMERVLAHGSRIPARMAFLKPLSAAIAIGTGGPFGAEGPIIATGGALGSLLGQSLRTSARERKTLLAAGAAAGMAATFGSPVSATLLALELLLFELSPRSLVPVALASATAAGVRVALGQTAPVFAMPVTALAGAGALGAYAAVGALAGLAGVGATRAIHAVEDAFERLPVHWMWWPALGALAVGVGGYFVPAVMGVGYDNIEHILGGGLVGRALLVLCVVKFVVWAVSLGSGTSGGTLAPLFTIGGALGALLGAAVVMVLPALGVDPRLAALVGMAAIFAGASRAVLTSVVFAMETTREPASLLPLLSGCAAAYLVSCLAMRHSIMTHKIALRGVRVPEEYVTDALARAPVGRFATRAVATLRADEPLAAARARLSALDAAARRHQGYPLVDAAGSLVGVVTRRELDAPEADAGASATLGSLVRRAPIVVFDDSTVREAVDVMSREDIGRLPIVTREAPRTVVGMLTRSDVLRAYRELIDAERRREVHLPPSELFSRRRRESDPAEEG